MVFFLPLFHLWLCSQTPHEARDKDSDGFPDAAELRETSDRTNFRKWFSTIALSRYLDPTKDIVDCADLVRYSYREALCKHDEAWRQKFGELLNPGIPELETFNYPDIPYIGTDIFRLSDGPYTPDDKKNGRLGNFADVKHLMLYHTEPLGRSRGEGVLPGDLLFFTPKGHPSHVMIYLEIRGEPYLIYHTGPGEKDKGEMRLVKFETLMSLDDETWRPDAKNPSFAGFYRFKILD